MRAAALAAALAILPLALSAQDVRERLGARVSPEVLAAVDSAAADAAARGLPVEPLIEKALEGAAKGVPADRVIAAVRALVTRLAGAAGALRRGGVTAPDPAAIEAGAFAITAGLTETQVRDLARASTGHYTPVATLRVAATLAALGVPPAQAVELLVANIQAGRSTTDLAALPGSVQGQVARGATPAQAAAGLARAAAAGRPSQPGRPDGAPGRRPPRP